METKRRSIVKSLTWRFCALLITFFVATFFLKDPGKGGVIAAFDFFIKFFAYYAHERGWNLINYGREEKHIEYEI